MTLASTRPKLAALFVQLLRDSLRPEYPLSGWPLLADVRVGEAWQPVAVYLGEIGSSGRKNRASERRIQNPSKGSAIQAIGGRIPLLLGVDTSEGSDPVLALWDASSRLGRQTRYSAFLTINDLDEARRTGFSERTSSSGERILVFKPDRFPEIMRSIVEETTITENQDLQNDIESELDFEGLGVALSALSQGDVPNSFPYSPSTFEQDEIDWSTNDWLNRVCEVQYWLGFDQAIEVDSSPAEVASEIFSELGAADNECFTSLEGVVHLTPFGFARLEERVSLAQSRKESFEQDLSDDFGFKQASKRWLSVWEDETEPHDFESVEVHAKVDNWAIKWFKDQVDEGALELNPSYQRDRVWSTSDSQKLVDSVLRGIPLPSIILNQRIGSQDYEIVDGKQRLTAILRFLGCHPEGFRYAKRVSNEKATLKLFEENYRKWRRILGIKSAEETRYCLPFRLSTYKNDSLSRLSGKYYCEIKSERVSIQGEEESVRRLFDGPSAYKIPVILYTKTDLRQIHRVFGLYNKQGKQLNAEELRNAIYHHLELTKLLLVLGGDSNRAEELVPFANDLGLEVVPDTLHELQVGVSRFHRTKLASWVAAILLHEPRRTENGIKTPSTAGYINSMLDAIHGNSAHPMRDRENLRSLASSMIEGAALMRELAGEEYAFSPSFLNKKRDGIRWEDLPTVATWTAATLAAIVGIRSDCAKDFTAALRETTETRPPLEKQQSRTQWGYLSRTIFELLAAMQVDLEELDGQLKQKLGTTCLQTLRDIDALGIELE